MVARIATFYMHLDPRKRYDMTYVSGDLTKVFIIFEKCQSEQKEIGDRQVLHVL